MTFIYELDPYSLKTFPLTENDFLRQGLRKLSYWIHTYNTTGNITTPLYGQ